MPFSKTLPTAALLLLLPLLLDPTALCSQAAKPHGGFGHFGRTHIRSNALPINTPAHHPLSPPPPPSTPWRHHVFLNFRGPDVRHTFSDHLYYALVRKGIKAFRDDRDLPRGENVKEAISRAIEDSKLSIVVLSRGYASSEYCLDELVKIMLTVKEKGHHPFPVFYHLSTDDVADHQWSGCYKDDFDLHKTRFSHERVKSWSQALTSIANISGWVLTADRSEAEMVEKIATNMLWKVQELGREESSAMASSSSGVIRRGESKAPPMEAAARTPPTDHTQSHPENEVANGSSCSSYKDEENITVEHHDHHDQASTASAISKEAAGEEEGDQKRRLWTSRTCTNSNKKDDNHHHQTDQQQLKYIKPEMSPQGKKTVRIPKTVAQEEIKKFWDFSLIGQHLSSLSAAPHHQINTTTILHEANKLWKITSSNEGITNRWLEVKQVGTTKNGLYLFTFSNKNTRDCVVEASPWCIANATFAMRKWQPNLQLYNLVQERASSIPVWVRLVGVPVEYMNAKGLSYIASGLGKPMYMDRATASKSQLAFAKVCVEMRLSEEGATTIVVALGGDGDDEDDNGVVEVVVRVFYQWRPCSCTSTSDCQGTAN